MEKSWLQAIGHVIHDANIQLFADENAVEKIARIIFREITQLHQEGRLPSNLRILTFAALRLRDIADLASWSKHVFPDLPVTFFPENVADPAYSVHINALKDEFPRADVPKLSTTVVSSLCEGAIDASLLYISVEESTNAVRDKPFISLKVKSEILGTSNLLTAAEYEAVYSRALDEFKNTDGVSDGEASAYASFVSMLLGLLRHWNVLILVSNNILDANNDKRLGLAGAVLCFERMQPDVVKNFVNNASLLFAPMLQLLVNAVLMESACHFHEHSRELVDMLTKVRPAMELLEKLRWDMHKAIGGSFGEDLAAFYADLCCQRDDKDGIQKRLSISPQEKNGCGDRGIWHLQYSSNRNLILQDWFANTFPSRYPHLADDTEFQSKLLARVTNIKNESDWEACFIKENRLENLFVGNGVGASQLFREKCLIFNPHIIKIQEAISRNFSESEIKCIVDKERGKVVVTVENVNIASDGIKEYLSLVKDVKSGYFDKIREHPFTWSRLYKGNMSVTWENSEVEYHYNFPNLSLPNQSIPADFCATTTRYYYSIY